MRKRKGMNIYPLRLYIISSVFNFITNKVKLFTNRSGQLAKGIDINLAI